MNALELNIQVLDRLAANDAVFPAEEIKDRALALATVMAELDTKAGESPAALLEPSNRPAEQLLGVLMPLVEYGSPSVMNAIPRALVHLARQTGLVGNDVSLRANAATLVVGRLAWSLAAYSMHCGRLGALNAALRASLITPYDSVASVLGASGLRHPSIFRQEANAAYEDYFNWLSSREIVSSRYQLFAAELEDCFAEGDLLLALRSNADGELGTYSFAFTSATVKRFRLWLADATHREELMAFFSVSGAELHELLEIAYGRLKGDPRRLGHPPGLLFTPAGSAG